MSARLRVSSYGFGVSFIGLTMNDVKRLVLILEQLELLYKNDKPVENIEVKKARRIYEQLKYLYNRDEGIAQLYGVIYREKHKDRIRERNREYVKKNRSRIIESDAKYRDRHKEKIKKDRNDAYYLKNYGGLSDLAKATYQLEKEIRNGKEK